MTAAAIAKASAPVVDVIVESVLWDAAPDAEKAVCRAVGEAAHALGAAVDGRSLAVLLTDDASSRRLNAQWRGLDKPTNVLSFPPAPVAHETATKSLGDIAIAYETTAREAQSEDKAFLDHLTHLTVHGFLHLLGYDHEAATQAEQMEQLERAILRRLGIADPYLTHSAEEVRG